MKIIFAIAGLIAGLFLGSGDEEILGAAIGLFSGYLLGQVRDLKKRLATLEEQEVLPSAIEITTSEAEAAATPPVPVPTSAAPQEPGPAAPVISSEWQPLNAAAEAPVTRQAATDIAEPAEPAAPTEPKQPNLIDRTLHAAQNWFTTGNIPVKLGVVISFFGVAFLLKYAVDRQLLVVPIEFRLLAVAVGAIFMLGLGWRLRNKVKVYALSLQGGGVGILYLTIFAALRLYQLIPPGLAFVMLVALTAFTGMLAILQNARGMAWLGIAGGFLAPVLVSTGSGNHVTLFSYYLLLNIAILGIAWFRSWRELNLMAFVFTFVIGGAWGFRSYEPTLYASTQPFLILYFLLFNAVAILFAFRQSPLLKGIVDGTLVFGTPVVAFSMQAVLVKEIPYGLAFSALGAGLFYLFTATALQRLKGRQARMLVEAYIALGVAFGTLAVPLALDARWTAATWALEAAALVWIGVRQDRLLARAAGSLLLFGAGIAFLEDGWQYQQDAAILNSNLLGGLIISVASLFSAWYLEQRPKMFALFQIVVARVLLVWAILWWLGTGLVQLEHVVPHRYESHAALIFIALSFAGIAMLARRLDWPAARVATFALLPLMLLVAPFALLTNSHFFAKAGWLAWPLAFGVQYAVLRLIEPRYPVVVRIWHVATLLLLTGLTAYETGWQIDRVTDGAWPLVAAGSVPAAVLAVLLMLRDRLSWPIQQHYRTYMLAGCGALAIIQLVLILLLNLNLSGDPAPLPYIPLLNPLGVATVLSLAAITMWLLVLRRTVDGVNEDNLLLMWRVIAAVGFITSTAAVVRGVHHIGGVPWNGPALFGSVMVQAALSIYWGLLAVAGMVWGARHARRMIWLAGAGLMGIVVLKLFVVDLGNTGSVARIVSFIGIGVLLLVVGYFAPAPPRKADADEVPAS